MSTSRLPNLMVATYLPLAVVAYITNCTINCTKKCNLVKDKYLPVQKIKCARTSGNNAVHSTSPELADCCCYDNVNSLLTYLLGTKMLCSPLFNFFNVTLVILSINIIILYIVAVLSTINKGLSIYLSI